MDANFIGYIALIIGLVGCGGYITYLFKTKQKAKIFEIIKTLVDEAEKKYGSGTGELKYKYVVDSLYAVIPSYVKLFVSERLLDLWIEKAVDELQEVLEKQIQK